jgi:predicted nucleic acid-binding protein
LRVAVIDSGPLINLVHLEVAGKLPEYFHIIFVPRTVHQEVNRKQRFRHRLRKLYEGGVFRRCRSADEANVTMLLADEQLDGGEAEGIVQAQEQQAGYFICDEKRAREIASKYRLTLVGTIRILARLNREGLADDPAQLTAKLRNDLQFSIHTRDRPRRNVPRT